MIESSDVPSVSPTSRGLSRSSRSRSTGTFAVVSSSMAIPRPIAVRWRPGRILLRRHPTRRVAHVFEARFRLLLADPAEDLLHVVPAFRGQSVAYGANFSHYRIVFHRLAPP